MESENDGMRSLIHSLRTISQIEDIFGKDSKLDERSKATVDKVRAFANENIDRLNDLADYLENTLPKDAKMSRITPGRLNISKLTVDSGYDTSENRLSGYLQGSSSSLQSAKSNYDRQRNSTNGRVRVTSSSSDPKISAGSLSSVFNSEKDLPDISEAGNGDKDSEISETAQSNEDGSEEIIKGELDIGCDRERLSDTKCRFTLGPPVLSGTDLQSAPGASAHDLKTNKEEVVEQEEEKTTDLRTGMNIPAEDKKILNAPMKKASREDLLRSVSMEMYDSTTNNFTAKYMLAAREDSTSSESDNLRSISSDGSICSHCGRRRNTRPSVDSTYS